MLLPTLLAAAILHTPAQQSRLPADGAGNTPAETAEGIEILRRILVDAVDEAFEAERSQKKKTGGYYFERQGFQVDGLVTTLWAGGRTVQHARAFHLPEVGLFFALDASLPVVTKEPEEESREGDAPANDEWERARREVRGSLSGALSLRRLHVVGSEVTGEIDPRAIDQLIDLALRTLSRHIGRIEGLGGRETVTLAVRLNGRQGWVHEFSEGPDAWEEDADERERPRGDESEAQALSTIVLAPQREVREQNLVVQIAVADLAAGNATPEQLRRAARINRY